MPRDPDRYTAGRLDTDLRQIVRNLIERTPRGVDEPVPVDPDLAARHALAAVVAAVDAMIERRIVSARRRDRIRRDWTIVPGRSVPWERIGEALGTTGQAVGKRARVRHLPVTPGRVSGPAKGLGVGQVRALPVRGVRCKDAVDQFLSTIPSATTRRGYAVELNRLVRDFGADSDVGVLEAERVGGWFTFVWGGCSAQTFNVRLASLRAACEYGRLQQWLVGDPLVRLVPRRVPADHCRAMTDAAEDGASTPMLMRHHAQTHPPLPGPNQREGRTIQTHLLEE